MVNGEWKIKMGNFYQQILNLIKLDYLNDLNCFGSTSSFQSPCERFPCKHGGACRPLYETDDYRCTCKQNCTCKNCKTWNVELLKAFCEFYLIWRDLIRRKASKRKQISSLQHTSCSRREVAKIVYTLSVIVIHNNRTQNKLELYEQWLIILVLLLVCLISLVSHVFLWPRLE